MAGLLSHGSPEAPIVAKQTSDKHPASVYIANLPYSLRDKREPEVLEL